MFCTEQAGTNCTGQDGVFTRSLRHSVSVTSKTKRAMFQQVEQILVFSLLVS